jgi:hypothetical protein
MRERVLCGLMVLGWTDVSVGRAMLEIDRSIKQPSYLAHRMRMVSRPCRL